MNTYRMTVRLILETDGGLTEATIRRAVLTALRDHNHENPLAQVPVTDPNSSANWDDIAVTKAKAMTKAEQIG